LWELFGAYFHAIRVNALLVIGKSVVEFKEILNGARVSGCGDCIVLRPVKVFRTASRFGIDLQDEVGEKCHWISGDEGIGWVVVNGTNGEGVDIFFCFRAEGSEKYVVCVDQRKRVAAVLGTKVASDLIEHARRIVPNVLKGATVIAGLCSMFPNYRGDDATLPVNSFVVARNCSNAYHGVVAGHPAARPFVAVNTDAKSWIQMFLRSKAAEVATAICKRRAGTPFRSLEELTTFVTEMGGTFQPDASDFLVFESNDE
jgi:hypothetical protein